MAEEKKTRSIDKDTLNLVIAVSAVLISAASFYAAYVQSVAAQRQVTAETWPYLQMDHGNFDDDAKEHSLYFRVVNAGVGPAHVKQLRLFYKGEEAKRFTDLFSLCCRKEEDSSEFLRQSLNNVVTGQPPPLILPPGDDILAFSTDRTNQNAEVWQRLDAARRHITGEACYCSLLNECYQTNFKSEPQPVKMCRAGDSVDFTR